jgi:hypothetical protein
MHRSHSDQGFDDFRRERKRVRAKLGPQASVLGYENQALRELEQVEAAEVRDQQLTREVHDFFAEATKQAAAIVNKVATQAKVEVGERLEGEVESFLIDTLSRMNRFVVTVMQQRHNPSVAEAQVEPHVGHIVGEGLDEFRWEGTTETRDAHIGQDPFETDLEEVQREFRAVVGEMVHAEPVASMEEHMVAQTADDDDAADRYGSEAPDDEQADEQAHAPTAKTAAPAATKAGADDTEDGPRDIAAELESFKGALKALVRQRVMQREEARAAWNARLAALGRGPA